MRYSLSVYKKKSFSKLMCGLSSTGGRTSSGRISVYHRGGASQRVLRIVDYKRFIWNTPGVVVRTEYSSFLRTLLSFIVYCNGFASYILTPNRLSVGSIVRNDSFFLSSIPGNASSLFFFPVGTFVHNIESRTGRGGQFLRSMGSYGRVMSKSLSFVTVKLKSGLMYNFSRSSIASFGTLDHFNFSKKIHNRAGFFRLRGIRPTVRGVAMNPIDHPHGGGEGKSAAGRPSVSRWGWLTKNVKKKN